MSKKDKKVINVRTKTVKLRQLIALAFLGAGTFLTVVEYIDSVAYVTNTIGILIIVLLFSALID